MLINLPNEIIYLIMLNLSISDLLNFGTTCKQYFDILQNDNFWTKPPLGWEPKINIILISLMNLKQVCEERNLIII